MGGPVAILVCHRRTPGDRATATGLRQSKHQSCRPRHRSPESADRPQMGPLTRVSRCRCQHGSAGADVNTGQPVQCQHGLASAGVNTGQSVQCQHGSTGAGVNTSQPVQVSTGQHECRTIARRGVPWQDRRTRPAPNDCRLQHAEGHRVPTAWR